MGAILLGIIMLSVTCARAESCDESQTLVSTTPVPEQTPGRLRKAYKYQASQNKSADIVIIGDSIAQHWGTFARRDFPKASVRNLGIGGERTQELAWRLRHLTTIKAPIAAILIIGTNNLAEKSTTPCGVATGVLAVVDEMSSLWPSTQIFVIPILPRGEGLKFRDADRRATNEMLAQSLREYSTAVLVRVDENDLTCHSLAEGCQNYRSDRLHLSSDGYELLRSSVASANFIKFGSNHLGQPAAPSPLE